MQEQVLTCPQCQGHGKLSNAQICQDCEGYGVYIEGSDGRLVFALPPFVDFGARLKHKKIKFLMNIAILAGIVIVGVIMLFIILGWVLGI